MMRDLSHAIRMLRRNPGFAAVAALTLALGIGANTAIFSFINTVVLQQLPVRDPGHLVLFGDGDMRGNFRGGPAGPMELFSWREYQDFRKAAVFTDVLAADSAPQDVYPSFSGAGSRGDGLIAYEVSGNFFDVLGVHATAGRLFDASMDNAPSPVIVLNYDFWQRRFQRDPAIVGQIARIGDRDYTIIGVAALGFSGIREGDWADMWIPLSMQPWLPGAEDRLTKPDDAFLNLMGRLKPGVSARQAQAAINLLLHQNMRTYLADLPDFSHALAMSAKARIALTGAARGISGMRKDFEQPLKILMWVVALVLAIAAANVASLVMAFNTKRQKEFAVRTAIGAGRSHLIRLVLAESVLLSGIGGALGILFASLGSRLLVHLISTGPRLRPIGFDPDMRVLAFTAAVSVVTGILFGIAPALRGTRPDLNSSLKESRASMASPRKVTFGRAMVVSQVALSMTLLISAGLLLRSFQNLIGSAIGFDRDHVLLFRLESRASGYARDQRLADLYQRIAGAISRLPGVVSDAIALRVFHEGMWTETITVPGLNLSDNDRVVTINFVTPGFLRTLHIPLLQGRELSEQDNASGERVAIVNETMAKAMFGGAAIGRTFLMNPDTEKDETYRIVGIARDVKVNSVTEKPLRMAWVPLAQNPVYAGDIAVRVSGNSAPIPAAVRGVIQSIAPNLPVWWVTTLADQVSDSLVTQRAIAQLTAFFARLAMLLAAIGLYGTISFAVARRTGEIGIRMALGAERTRVVAMVLSDAAKLILAGIAIGLPLAFGATTLVRSVLYGVGRFDALSVVGAILALSVAATIAGYLPARRASRVDPMVALRYE